MTAASQVIPSAVEVDGTPVKGPTLTGFRQFSFGFEGISHCVYHAGNRADPPLLLMPEIAGLSPGLLLFGERLIAARYQIYVPWLFGPFRTRAPLRNALKLCISREFAHLRTGTSAPIASWLRALAGYISQHNGDSYIGAIGMCLTGAFAIPLVIDPRVKAAVAAQPSVPCSLLFASLGLREPDAMSALNVSASDIDEARKRLASEAAHLLAVRCRADRLCPTEKLERLRREFPTGMIVKEYGEPSTRNTVHRRPHALFTKEYRIAADASPNHFAHRAFDDLLAFFDQHLRGTERR